MEELQEDQEVCQYQSKKDVHVVVAVVAAVVVHEEIINGRGTDVVMVDLLVAVVQQIVTVLLGNRDNQDMGTMKIAAPNTSPKVCFTNQYQLLKAEKVFNIVFANFQILLF